MALGENRSFWKWITQKTRKWKLAWYGEKHKGFKIKRSRFQSKFLQPFSMSFFLTLGFLTCKMGTKLLALYTNGYSKKTVL